ncbi:unnamed protein product [Allacma fusca]|uniref:Uncharacterized protein n=1 Tax=Allacma fusca TaxID=39272 RepID=A0A8J2P7E9_9HEXA|nr:unnamed protein product [Allacma fusca]
MEDHHQTFLTEAVSPNVPESTSPIQMRTLLSGILFLRSAPLNSRIPRKSSDSEMITFADEDEDSLVG